MAWGSVGLFKGKDLRESLILGMACDYREQLRFFTKFC